MTRLAKALTETITLLRGSRAMAGYLMNTRCYHGQHTPVQPCQRDFDTTMFGCCRNLCQSRSQSTVAVPQLTAMLRASHRITATGKWKAAWGVKPIWS